MDIPPDRRAEGGDGVGKLIDADVFDSILKDAQAECKKNGGNFRFGVLNSVRANLANQPAVDAVPVEWVKKKITGATKDLGAVIHDGVLKELLFDWQKEQEAR